MPTNASGVTSCWPRCTAPTSTPMATANAAGKAPRKSSTSHHKLASSGSALGRTLKNCHSLRVRSERTRGTIVEPRGRGQRRHVAKDPAARIAALAPLRESCSSNEECVGSHASLRLLAPCVGFRAWLRLLGPCVGSRACLRLLGPCVGPVHGCACSLRASGPVHRCAGRSSSHRERAQRCGWPEVRGGEAATVADL